MYSHAIELRSIEIHAWIALFWKDRSVNHLDYCFSNNKSNYDERSRTDLARYAGGAKCNVLKASANRTAVPRAVVVTD